MSPSKAAIVRSPITGRTDVTMIARCDCASIINEYMRTFSINTARFFGDYKEIALYRCNASGYRFYYPANIIGDGNFYHNLEVNDWYYMAGKWEFEESIKHIKSGLLLEIGSAKGSFLAAVQRAYPTIKVVGLELNEIAARRAIARGFDVRIETTTEHAKSLKEKYDVVVAFQVLEHIANPIQLLRDAVNMLKPGGKLLIGVPDNSDRATKSLFVAQENILNMPPHHQGLWDIVSLSYLTHVFPLKLESLKTEPAIASHHSNSYRHLIKASLANRFGKTLGILLYAIGRPFYDHALQHLNKYLPAHSIFAVYVKEEP